MENCNSFNENKTENIIRSINHVVKRCDEWLFVVKWSNKTCLMWFYYMTQTGGAISSVNRAQPVQPPAPAVIIPSSLPGVSTLPGILCLCSAGVKVKSKAVLSSWWKSISELPLSLAIWDHTVLLTTRHKRTHPALTPASEGWYSIYLLRRDGRLSWPRWLVTYQDGLPTHRRSPIQVLTRPGVE